MDYKTEHKSFLENFKQTIKSHVPIEYIIDIWP